MFNELDPWEFARAAEEGQPLPWQYLESILSVCLDLVERQKVVALHKSVKEPPPMFDVEQEDGTMAKVPGWASPSPQCDPATGARRVGCIFEPWVMTPFSNEDLEEPLARWDDLVQHVEDRLSSLANDEPLEYGLYSQQIPRDARIQDDGFVWQFLTKARKPRFTYLGPGLRLPTAAELTDSPARQALLYNDSGCPIVVLRGEQDALSPWHWMNVDRIPWGLYIEGCNPDSNIPTPFEDSCRMVLPYDIGGKGHAKKSDGRSVSGNHELYQMGLNPFMPQHSPQLLTVLAHFAGCVKSDMWVVGPDGVDERAEWFKLADTDMAQWADTETEIFATTFAPIYGAGERYW